MTDLAEGRSIDDLGERSKSTGVLLGMPYDSRRLVLRTDRSTLIDLLFDDANYLQYPNACVFHADFGYRFESGYGAVEVVFSGTGGDAVVEVDGAPVRLLSGALTGEAGGKLMMLSRRLVSRRNQ